MTDTHNRNDEIEIIPCASWIETEGGDERSSFAEIHVIKRNGKHALGCCTNTDSMDHDTAQAYSSAVACLSLFLDYEMLTDYTYDALYVLPHTHNRSYFAGFIGGKCQLLRVSMIPRSQYVKGTVLCRAVTDAENDSIMWKSYGDDMLLLCRGKMMRTYCVRTHSFSEWYYQYNMFYSAPVDND